MVDIPSIPPFPWATAPQMGGRSQSTVTLHAKRRCRRETVTTFPVSAGGEGGIEGIATIYQALMRGLPSCCRVFRGRAHFRGSLPLIVFFKKMSLLNLSLDPACTGEGGSHPGSRANNRPRRPPMGVLKPIS